LPRIHDPTDEELLDAVRAYEEAGGNVSAAAVSIGLARTTLSGRLRQAVKRGLKEQPPRPTNTPEGMMPSGVSIYYGPHGEKARWEKFKAEDTNRQAVLEEVVSCFSEPLKGLHKPGKAPAKLSRDLKTEYVLADLHVGMYAWGQETGNDDYDTDKAVALATNIVRRLIESSPPSQSCILNQLGDFYHTDSNTPATPSSGNILDTDTRFRRVVRSGITLIRSCIEMMLEKHATVEIRNTPGNHDIHSSMILDEALKAYYHNDKRVIVHDSPKAFWAYRFGNSVIGIAHGHAPKPKKLPGLLAADYPQWWAECAYKACRHGHLHTTPCFEEMTVWTEGFQTLAAPDAWSISEGYRAGRGTQSIVLHIEDGEIERHTARVKPDTGRDK
jgi:transposase-like protein/metallophosphoesterase superfamily enzyme